MLDFADTCGIMQDFSGRCWIRGKSGC